MATHFVPDDQSASNDPSLRLIVDTNVIGPALRWLAADKRPPSELELLAVTELQRYVAQRKMKARVRKTRITTAIDLRLAILEGSRDVGTLRADRLARMVAAGDLLADRLYENRPLRGRFIAERPLLEVDAESFAALEGAPEYRDHSRTVLALIGLQDIHSRRTAGGLRSPIERFRLLQEWETMMRRHVVLSSVLMRIGVQVALGNVGDAPASICKFHSYRDLKSARRAAWNAAWDLTFLRAVGASKHGAFPYSAQPMPAVLVTSDRALAETVTAVGPTHGVDHLVTGRRLTASILDLEDVLPSVLRKDDTFMDGFRSWVSGSSRAQQERHSVPQTYPPDDETDELVQRALRDRFQTARGN